MATPSPSKTSLTWGFKLEFVVGMPREDHQALLGSAQAELSKKYDGTSLITQGAMQTTLLSQSPAARQAIYQRLPADVPVHAILACNHRNLDPTEEGVYDKWRVDFDTTITVPEEVGPGEGFEYGCVELVSRVLQDTTEDNEEVKESWRMLSHRAISYACPSTIPAAVTFTWAYLTSGILELSSDSPYLSLGSKISLILLSLSIVSTVQTTTLFGIADLHSSLASLATTYSNALN